MVIKFEGIHSKNVTVENYGLTNMDIRIDISFIRFNKNKDTVFEAANEADFQYPCKIGVQIKAPNPLTRS